MSLKLINTDVLIVGAGGAGMYASIAAASILAKTYRDKLMIQLHNMVY